VLSAVLIRTPNDLTVVEAAKAARAKLGRPEKKPLHWRHLRHEKKVYWAQRIAELNVRCMAVAADKAALLEPEKFESGYRLYFYTVRYLLERVSWLVRDAGPGDCGDGTAELIFSNRSSMSYRELDDYLARLQRSRAHGLDVRIEFAYLGARKTYTPEKRAGLQAADAFAGAVWNALEVNPHGFAETRYLATFLPVVWRRAGRTLGYGIKIAPREAEAGLSGSEFWRVVSSAGPGP
jgi:hypothetical protein